MKTYVAFYSRRNKGAEGLFSPGSPKTITADNKNGAFDILWDLVDKEGDEMTHPQFNELGKYGLANIGATYAYCDPKKETKPC